MAIFHDDAKYLMLGLLVGHSSCLESLYIELKIEYRECYVMLCYVMLYYVMLCYDENDLMPTGLSVGSL